MVWWVSGRVEATDGRYGHGTEDLAHKEAGIGGPSCPWGRVLVLSIILGEVASMIHEHDSDRRTDRMSSDVHTPPHLRPPERPGNLQGKVVRIADGDTITVLVDRQEIKVRLSAIDAPERGQDFY